MNNVVTQNQRYKQTQTQTGSLKQLSNLLAAWSFCFALLPLELFVFLLDSVQLCLYIGELSSKNNT